MSIAIPFTSVNFSRKLMAGGGEAAEPPTCLGQISRAPPASPFIPIRRLTVDPAEIRNSRAVGTLLQGIRCVDFDEQFREQSL